MTIGQKIKDGVLFVALAGADLLRASSYEGQYQNLVNGYAHDVCFQHLYISFGVQ